MSRLKRLKIHPLLVSLVSFLGVLAFLVGFAAYGKPVLPAAGNVTEIHATMAAPLASISAPILAATTAGTSSVTTTTTTTTPAIPTDTTGALGMVPAILHAFSTGDYSLGFAMLLLVLVYVIRTFFWKSIPGAMVPIATAGLATLTSIAGALYVHTDPVHAIAAGLGIGLATVGFWECVGKHVEDFIQFKMGKTPDAPK